MPGRTALMPRRLYRRNIGVLALVAVVALMLAGMVAPFGQDPAYHRFADQRVLLGIPHFGDVVSNIGLLIVGALGLAFVTGGRGRAVLTEPSERLPYQIFFTAIALIAFGSAYYHADPTDQTLFWDRLAMTIAYSALLALFIADRVHGPVGVRVMLPLLVALGAGALIYWRLGEAAGAGDLRFYFLSQFYPALMIPLICLLFPGRHTLGRYVLYLFVCYAFVVGSEWLDHEIYALSDGVVSGHSLKHLFAALAASMIHIMLVTAVKRSRPSIR
ncbi:MAG: alkaline phytoceramidase [Proteobacteria bacterium]|nr:alkaline phytoceramidase [Pseudomonadota bacterium]